MHQSTILSLGLAVHNASLAVAYGAQAPYAEVVSLGTSGGFHDPVQRHELRYNELAHQKPPVHANRQNDHGDYLVVV
jgi:hypothetical protein